MDESGLKKAKHGQTGDPTNQNGALCTKAIPTRQEFRACSGHIPLAGLSRGETRATSAIQPRGSVPGSHPRTRRAPGYKTSERAPLRTYYLVNNLLFFQ